MPVPSAQALTKWQERQAKLDYYKIINIFVNQTIIIYSLIRMKKIYLLLAAVAMIFAAACQNDQPQDPNKPSGVDDPSVTPEAQIEETSKAFMAALDINNWRNEAEYVHKVAKSLSNKDFNDQKLEEWVDALSQSWQQAPRKEGNTTIYETIVRLSDAKGHFEEKADGSFKFEEANDFQFTVLVDGEKVTATFTCTDSKVPLIISSGVYFYSYYDNDTYQEKREEHNNLLYVPTNAVLKILRGNNEFASIVLNTSVDVNDSNNPNPYTDSASLDVVIKVGVYTINVNKVAYSPTGANVNIKLFNGNASLLFVGADAVYNLDPASHSDIPVKNGSVNAEVDIMGKIQLKGQIPDFAKFWEAGQNLNDNNQDAKRYPALVSEFEKTFSANMFFNGSSSARASLGMEAVKYDGNNYWYCNPVFRFSDGSSYGVEDYFTEDRFGGLIQYTDSWLDNIEEYLSGLFSDIY